MNKYWFFLLIRNITHSQKRIKIEEANICMADDESYPR